MTTQCSCSRSPHYAPDRNPSGDPNQVTRMGKGNLTPPVKTITLTNNTSHTVYPFLATPNDAALHLDPGGSGTIYSPKDPKNEDYRGYIGYTQNGINDLGLS